MPQTSLNVRLSAIWISTVIIALSLAAILYQSYAQGPGSQMAKARALTEHSCEELTRKFAWSLSNRSFSPDKKNEFEYALLEIILDHYDGVEGGFWNATKGFGSYAFPTYDGNGIKRDVPESEKAVLTKLSREAGETRLMQSEFKRGSREGIFYTACPLSSEAESGAVWTMTRIPITAHFAYSKLQRNLLALLVFVLVSGLGLSLLVYRWIKNVRQLEDAILHQLTEDHPPLESHHERELNRIVEAFNQLQARFRASQAEAKSLQRRLAQNDRLAVLGKMAAEMAHEIRNPLATIRLKFENAMVAPVERMEAAAPLIYDQIARIDRLIHMLLAVTQQFEIKPQLVSLDDWVNLSFSHMKKIAADKSIDLNFKIGLKEWSFDPFHLARALENLISNAVAFTPEKGSIHVHFSKNKDRLAIDIEDTGPGISAAARDTLFQPFHTGRKEGHGLGLVLAQDIAQAHGGTLEYMPGSQGARFKMEIPWQKSL